MRQICEIVADAKDGKIPTHEECYWVMLALSGKLHFANGDLRKIAEAMEKGDANKLMFSAKLQLSSEQKVYSDHFNFLKTDPLKWLGTMGNPFTEENKRFTDMGKQIIANAEKRIKDS